MKGFNNALAFLTILPIKGGTWSKDTNMLQWFPLAGLIIGLLWMGFDALAGLFFPGQVRAVLDMLFLVLITGGLHLDGLADAADGIMAHRGKVRALEIMRDSRLGAWGAIALIAILLINTAAISALLTQEHSWRGLLLAPAYGRLAMLFGIKALPYGRPEGGMASSLFEQNTQAPCWAATLALLSLILYPLPIALAMNLLVAITIWGLIHLYRTNVGCITGDMIGAMGEITQTAVLLALSMG